MAHSGVRVGAHASVSCLGTAEAPRFRITLEAENLVNVRLLQTNIKLDDNDAKCSKQTQTTLDVARVGRARPRDHCEAAALARRTA